MQEDELFFVGQKAIFEHNGSILLLNDPDIGDDLPGGKIQVGESDFAEALKREVREETTLEITVGQLLGIASKPFANPKTDREKNKRIFLVVYACTYLSGELKLSHEHDTYKWVTKENYKSEVTTEWIVKYLELYFNSKG
jgi:8-oxo-dGTP diphosphatase